MNLTNANASKLGARSDPSPVALDDGSVYVAYGAEPTDDPYETVGLMWAPHWRGPFTLIPEPIALPSTLHCPTGNLAEDPYLWHDGAP